MKFLGCWREARAEDIPVANIEALALKAERLDKPVNIRTGEAIEGGCGDQTGALLYGQKCNHPHDGSL
jgi:hypothetical protein